MMKMTLMMITTMMTMATMKMAMKTIVVVIVKTCLLLITYFRTLSDCLNKLGE